MSKISCCLFLTLVLMTISALSQYKDDLRKFEREIRLLDQAAAKAILERDEKAIDLYFAPHAVTNNPRSGLTYGNEGVKQLFKTGVINYASFERAIEHVEIHDNTAIVMGSETLTVAGKDWKPGETIRRRYTNVWMKTGRQWQIVARHANIICQ